MNSLYSNKPLFIFSHQHFSMPWMLKPIPLIQSLLQINSTFPKPKTFLRPQFNIFHLPLKYFLLNYQNISIQISPWVTTIKAKAYCSITPIPYNSQIFHINHSYFTFVTMNSTIHRSMGHDTMRLLFSLIIKNGTIPLRYPFTVISNSSKLIKRLFKILTIIGYSSLCLLGILIISNGSANALNIGQLLNLIFSNLFEKCSLMFIFV